MALAIIIYLIIIYPRSILETSKLTAANNNLESTVMHIYILLLVTLKHHFREVCLQELEESLRIGALSCV